MSNSSTKVQNLFLEQFTAFENATFDFCPGINVLIGANATGKSHVMKAIYALLKVREAAYRDKITTRDAITYTIHNKLSAVFQAHLNLVRHGGKQASVRLNYEDTHIEFSIELEQVDALLPDVLRELSGEYKLESPDFPAPVIYLPAQEYLSINKGFIATYSKRELPYDETYYDLSLALNALPLRSDKLVEVKEIIAFLRQIIAGKQENGVEIVTQENGRFKFSLPEGELDVHLVAEGYRKLATLLYLLRNGSLTKDSTLFWDEPEANLNPKLIVEVVRVLQKLASVGIQIFIATHDYLLSHELSLLAEYPSEKSVDVRFFALHKPDRKAGVLVESGQTLAEIEHNLILEEFAAHYDRESNLFHQSQTANEPNQ
ncbi:ATP/GTP-binding protein [Chloroflexota bacterium]